MELRRSEGAWGSEGGITSKMDWIDRKMTPQSLGIPCMCQKQSLLNAGLWLQHCKWIKCALFWQPYSPKPAAWPCVHTDACCLSRCCPLSTASPQSMQTQSVMHMCVYGYIMRVSVSGSIGAPKAARPPWCRSCQRLRRHTPS